MSPVPWSRPAPPTSLVALGAPDGRAAWTVQAPGRTLAVFVVDGALRVTDALCPHQGGPLVEGVVIDGRIACPWHGYRFDLVSGDCRTSRRTRLRVHPTVHRDGQWYAEVPLP